MMRLLLCLFLLVLSGCGFHPLYAGKDRPELASVTIDDIDGRSGQQLRLLLVDRFYSATPKATPRYRLSIKYVSSKEELAIRTNDVATRARLIFTGTLTLTTIDGSAPPFTSTDRSFVSYNILTDPYATQAAEDNATTRGLTALADSIANRVALHLAGLQQ